MSGRKEPSVVLYTYYINRHPGNQTRGKKTPRTWIQLGFARLGLDRVKSVTFICRKYEEVNTQVTD